MLQLHNVSEGFQHHKYAVLRSFLEPPAVAFYYQSAINRAKSDTMAKDDPMFIGTPYAYGDPVMELLLEQMAPKVELASGRQVFPTYSFFRVYKAGDVLKKHSDRQSCEISLTVTLGYHANQPWPFWIESPTGIASIDLYPGDAVLYRGIECPHWRDAFLGEHLAQVFLHYVDKDGPQAEWRFDKRDRLNSLRNPILR